MPRPTFPDLRRAMAAYGIPLENQPIIERICSSVVIKAYVPYSNHFRAIRANKGPDLWIYWGWTEGFFDQEDVLHATGGQAPFTRSDYLGSGQFYVEHPLNRLHTGGGGGSPRRKVRAIAMCPIHNLALPPSGICDDCS